jgi:ASCH domain
MRALSIRQPWAALVVAGVKDIENRPWRTSHRGQLLIHASLGRSGRSLTEIARTYGIAITDELTQLSRLVGGIMGVVDLVDCVNASVSRWYDGPINSAGRRNFGLVLSGARPLPFIPAIGRLGLFETATQIATGPLMMSGDGVRSLAAAQAKKADEIELRGIGRD